MTATKGAKKGGGKKGKKDSDVDKALGYGAIAVGVYGGFRIVLQAVVDWWDTAFLPWWEQWHRWLAAGAVLALFAAVLAGALWARSAWLRRMQTRAEKRQPGRPGKEKPTVRVEADETTRAATAVVVTHDHADHPTPHDVERLADIHGTDHWGQPAKAQVVINKKTGRTQVVLTPPDPEPVRDSVERDLATLARETLPEVSDVRVTARDSETGLPTRIEVHHEVTAKVFTARIVEAIENALAAKLAWTDPNTYRMTWDPMANVGVLEQRTDPLARVVPYPFGCVTDIIDRDTKMLYFGVTGDGRELQGWDLDQRPHTLISGETGFGKSATEGVFIVQALLMGWRVVLIEPKKRTFRYLEGLPNLERYGDAKGLESARQMASAIRAVHTLMEDRYDLDDEALDKQQRVLVVVDELYELYAALNRLWLSETDENGKPNRGEHPDLQLLLGLSSLARESMIHLLFTIQRPDVSIMGNKGAGFMRAQLGNRIALGPMDPEGAGMMFGRGNPAAKSATQLPVVKGRCLAPLPDGVPGYRPGQVWWLDLKDRAIRERVRDLVLAAHPASTAPLVQLRPSERAPDNEAGASETGGVDVTKPEPVPPAKKAPARRPAKKGPAVDGDSGPEIISRDPVLAGRLKRDDWTVIVEEGQRRNVRIETAKLDDDAGKITISGFGWSRTFDVTDTVPLLHVREG